MLDLLDAPPSAEGTGAVTYMHINGNEVVTVDNSYAEAGNYAYIEQKLGRSLRRATLLVARPTAGVTRRFTV